MFKYEFQTDRQHSLGVQKQETECVCSQLCVVFAVSEVLRRV